MEVLAVDGGQSAVRLRHTSGSADTELEGVSRLEGDPIASIAATVAAGWRELGSPRTDRAVLGLTTAPTDEPSQTRLCDTVAQRTGAREVWLADDAVTGHAGALDLGSGISVIAGTGVACAATTRSGHLRIVGGHGYLIGDEGGGFWIGSAGLRAALKAEVGRGPKTTMQEAAARHFDGLVDLGDRLHSGPRPVDLIARFAPAVIEAAHGGDARAEAILDAAATELVTLVEAAERLVDTPGRPIPLALGGRLLHDGPYRERLEQALAEASPGLAIRSAAGSPLDGAMGLALAEDPDDYLERVFVWEATP